VLTAKDPGGGIVAPEVVLMTGAGLVVVSGDGGDPVEERVSGESAAGAMVNEVTLRGRVSREPELRELPSGTLIVTVRISVARAPSPMSKGSKQGSKQGWDWVDCVAWGARQRRRVSTWRVGDIVEVEGALRRRIYRGGAGTAMLLEVEVLAGRMIGRADRRSVSSS
jgi:single-strand DNA-binding protein